MERIHHVNPDGLMKSPVFSQIVITRGSGKTIYIGGQNSVNANREIVGINDIQVQTRKTMENIESALKACDASFENLVKLNIHIVQGQNLVPAFQESQKFLQNMSAPPAITVLYVAGLANPAFLIEIDAIAFIPD